MDIASLSMTLSHENLMSDIGVALLSKSLDMTETLATDVSTMITEMPTISPDGIGNNVDISI